MKKRYILIFTFFMVASIVSSCKKETCNCTIYKSGTVEGQEEYTLEKGEQCSEFQTFDEKTQTGIRCDG